MRALQASTRHEECIDRQRGLLDKLAAQKKIDDYERADPEGAEDASISMYPRLVEFLAREGVSDISQQSYGVSITELCKVLGAAVVVFIEYDHKLATMVQTLKFHFCVYFLADLLAEINALNKFFQRRKVDITLMHQEVDRTIACIRHRFVEYDNGFGGGVSKLVSPFIARMASGNMKIKVDDVDMEGEPTLHEIELSEEPIKGHKFGRSMADCIKL
ncbi:unnamed protein product [Closterium sp. Naga37s-1]|nr:unnamed protein product [Closterium sp. Naga37s-1]